MTFKTAAMGLGVLGFAGLALAGGDGEGEAPKPADAKKPAASKASNAAKPCSRLELLEILGSLLLSPAEALSLAAN